MYMCVYIYRDMPTKGKFNTPQSMVPHMKPLGFWGGTVFPDKPSDSRAMKLLVQCDRPSLRRKKSPIFQTRSSIACLQASPCW